MFDAVQVKTLSPVATRKGIPNKNRSTTPNRFRSKPKMFNTCSCLLHLRLRPAGTRGLRRMPEAYLFATTLKHLNRDDCVPPNEELGRGKLPVDLLRSNGSRTELLNRVGSEPEPHATLPDHGSLYGPPTGIIRWCGTDDEPRVVIVKPDGNFPGVLVHCCVSGKATDAADAAKLVSARRARRD